MKKVLKLTKTSDYEVDFEITKWNENSYHLVIQTSNNATGKWMNNTKNLFLSDVELKKLCDYFNEVGDAI